MNKKCECLLIVRHDITVVQCGIKIREAYRMYESPSGSFAISCFIAIPPGDASIL
jgi:hypothetical protein